MRSIILFLAVVLPLALDASERGEDMEEIVVVASKIERPLYRVASQVTQLTRDDLQLQQVQTLGEIARYEPALDAEYSGSRFGATGISVRGVGGNRVVMEMDGVPLPQHFAVGEFANASRNLIDPAMIERIEVLRGPASSLYGSDAIGGVIAITSIEPVNLVNPGAQHLLGGGGSLRSVDDGRAAYLTYGYSGDSHGFELSGSHRNSHEPDNRAESIPTDLTDATDRALFSKWTYRLAPATQLRAIADFYDRETTSDIRSVLGYGRQYASTVALYGQDAQDRLRLSLDVTSESLGAFDLANLMVFYQESEVGQDTRDFRASTGVINQRIERHFELKQEQTGLEGKVRRDFRTGPFDHVLVAGVEWERDLLVEARDGLSTNLVTGDTSKVLPPGELLPQRDLPRSEVTSSGVYIQDELQSGNWTFIPALRWDQFRLDASTDLLLTDPDRITNLRDDNLSARFGLTYQASDGLTLFGHYAEGFRAPPAEDVNLYLDYRGFVTVRALPNPDLKPEESRNAEVGLRFRQAGTSLEISAYRSRYSNFIESRVRIGIDPNDGAFLFQSRNIESARIVGFEAGLSQSLRTIDDALAAWSVDLALHTSRGENTDTGAPINLVNPAKVVFGLNWNQHANLSASLKATHFAEQTRIDLSAGNFFVAPAATVFDLIGRWSVSRSVDLSAAVYNLADKRYWKYSTARMFQPNDPRIDVMSQPGRSVAVSINVGY